MLESLSLPLAITAWHWAFIIPISLVSIFLTLLILVQRGRGGGLTGALGGMGGQSAFGAKAGDLFTKITIITAMFWILLSMGALKLLHVGKLSKSTTSTPPATTVDPKGVDSKTGDTAAPIDTKPGPGLTPETTPAPKSDTPAAPADASATPSDAPKSSPPADAPATPEKSADDKK